MKAALISLGSVSSKWTLEEMKNFFDEVDDINIKGIEITLGGKQPTIMYNGEPLDKYDCVLAKGSFRYNQLLRSITAVLYGHCYMPIRASAFTVGHDKLLTQLRLQQEGIPMPVTYVSSTPNAAKKMLKCIHYPIIMKFPEGTQGKGIMFADSFASANSILDALAALRQPFIIQEYVETSGVDTRAFVVGDKVVAAMKRKAIDGEKRANIHAGGVGEATRLDNFTKKIAIEAAGAIGAEICAIDILQGSKGPLVIEANLSPGLQGITKATGINVASKIAKYLYEKTKDYSDSMKATGTDKIMQDVGIQDVQNIKEIITNISFRGNRILLPEIVTTIADFNEKEELILRVDRGKLTLQRLSNDE
ncbi:MAG: RimK family alpha-L-glutamate ligase [archaeon]